MTKIKVYHFMPLLLIISILLIVIIIFANIIYDKTKQLEFENLREGICVYVEYPNAYDADIGPIPNYLLVYDEELDKVIEIDIYEEVVHTKIYTGDIICYYLAYDYSDADFINVIKRR